MFDSRNNLSEMVVNDVRKHFGKQVYQTFIPRNVRISEAPSFGQPVLMYDINCSGSKAYIISGRIITTGECKFMTKSSNKTKKVSRGLGRGLSTLLGDAEARDLLQEHPISKEKQLFKK